MREFHALMEQEVFRHSGMLDKYLGDGLMATFGTPFAGEADASTRYAVILSVRHQESGGEADRPSISI